MHVDLRDFRFVSATRGPGEALSLLVSRGRNSADIQLVRVAPPDAAPLALDPEPEDPETSVVPELAAGLAAELMAQGHVVLTDLAFASGADTLAAGSYETLQDLADFMSDHPRTRLLLVGHTDSTGDPAANLSLSRRRADSVRARLLAEFGLDPARVGAEGAGHLAPRASNLNESGREANRRVEAVLLSDG